jgi:hypothetical protein
LLVRAFVDELASFGVVWCAVQAKQSVEMKETLA